jgi:tRNA pseudouridine38/39 synthase
MLDIKKNPTRTAYTMANEVPLVLWDCIFSEPSDLERRESLRWVYPSEECAGEPMGSMVLSNSVWGVWRERKIDEILAAQFAQFVNERDPPGSGPPLAEGKKVRAPTERVFDGGNNARLSGRYIPVMKLKKMMSVDEQNEMHAKKKGYTSVEELKIAMRELAIAKKAMRAANDTQCANDG